MKLVELLLSHNADCSLKDSKGLTAQDYTSGVHLK